MGCARPRCILLEAAPSSGTSKKALSDSFPKSDPQSGRDFPDPAPEAKTGPQLSFQGRVRSGVTSVAIDGGLAPVRGRSTAGLQVPASRYEGLTDAEVMLRLKTGDDAAFDYLVEKYRRPMLSFMYRMAHNSAVAEELVQEIFLRVYRSRQTYNAEAKFSTWLYRIASNLAVNYARDTKHERPELSVNLDEPDTETGTTIDLPDGSPSAEQVILRQERLAAIRQHVHNLPERQRMAVLMHKYQGMDYSQIAEVLKLSESAVKSLLFRAYETLRIKLKDFI